jgi:transcriptional regulator PpsR
MDATDSTAQRIWFTSPAQYLTDLDPVTTGRLIACAADVALIVDQGVVRDVALANEELTREGYDRSWRDQPWIDTVTTESRRKIEDLLHVGPADAPRWREVNHPSVVGGVDVPIQYTALQAGRVDRIVALGRDLRAIARLQQRLVEAHQSLERDYSRLREAEARYQLLFHSISEPVLIADASTLVLEEANPAAAALLGEPIEALRGQSLEALFAASHQRQVGRVVAESVPMGAARAAKLRLRHGPACDVSAASFREKSATRVIVRLEAEGAEPRRQAAARSELLGVLEALPDGLVVTGSDLRILAANRAFVEMAHLTSPEQMVGSRLSDFLGRSPTDLNVLVSNLKSHGVVRNFSTVLRDRFGYEEEVEVSAVAAPEQEAAAFGFSVRSVARRLRTTPRVRDGLPSSAEQLTGLIGRVPLREIVRESTDFIEKLCIEAALEITDDNRASAAEMLGLSRQGLYSKLKRFGLDDSR